MEKKTRGGVRDEAASIKKKIQEVERKGANLWWSPANRLCGPCVPAWRKLARHGKSTHTHTSIHTRPAYTTTPKGRAFIECKHTLYTFVQYCTKFKEQTHSLACVWLSGRLPLHLSAHIKVFWSRTGQSQSERCFCCCSGPTKSRLCLFIIISFYDSLSASIVLCVPLCLAVPVNNSVMHCGGFGTSSRNFMRHSSDWLPWEKP